MCTNFTFYSRLSCLDVSLSQVSLIVCHRQNNRTRVTRWWVLYRDGGKRDEPQNWGGNRDGGQRDEPRNWGGNRDGGKRDEPRNWGGNRHKQNWGGNKLIKWYCSTNKCKVVGTEGEIDTHSDKGQHVYAKSLEQLVNYNTDKVLIIFNNFFKVLWNGGKTTHKVIVHSSLYKVQGRIRKVNNKVQNPNLSLVTL